MGLMVIWRNKWGRRVIEAVLFLCVFLAIAAYQKRSMVEGPAPLLSGTTLAGVPFDLAAAQGKPVVVHFWASWCPICRAEEGTIAGLAKDHPVITVAMQSGGAAEVEKHMRERGFHVPVLVDEEGAMAASWGVRGVPATFVVDGSGEIRFREMGYTTGLGLRLRLWWASVTE